MLVCRKKKLYLRIGEGGSPIVCGKKEAKVFDEIKAQNVLDHLPKALQKMNFVKEPVVQSELNISDEEEIPRKKIVIVEKTVVKNTSYNKKTKKVIKNTSYKTPQNVMNWVDRVTQCNDLFLDAEERRRELLDCLSNTDKNLSNILHKIELEDDMNACMGFMQYKKIRECLRRRRIVKDEIYMDKREKKRYLFNYSDIDRILFANKLEALTLITDAEKDKPKVSNERFYEED